MISLDLFNAVLISDNAKKSDDLMVEKTVPLGFILQPEVAALDNVEDIIRYVSRKLLTGEQMNYTFHKSWAKIENSTSKELLSHQLIHYFTTYGLGNLGLYSNDTVYIPNEVLKVPEVENLPLKVIKGLTKDELIEKSLNMLESGVALKSETIDSVLALLDELEYEFKSIDNIKNKEAKLKISVKFNILPDNNTEFVRFLVYKATGSALLITNPETLKAIEISGFQIEPYCVDYGLERLSQSFLRYKRIFLAFKKVDANTNNPFVLGLKKLTTYKYGNAYIVNKLRKLAKKNHKPMPVDYLNNLTGLDEVDIDKLTKELDKVNNFRKIRLLYALQDRMIDHSAMVYKIRNGKTFVKEIENTYKNSKMKFGVVYSHLLKGLNLVGTKVKYPSGIDYVLPTSEKNFVGNFPSGSYVDITNDLVVGIYWEEAWGARDIDLSGISLTKVGWNSRYSSGGLMYSGDMTRAANGASECLYAKGDEIKESYLVKNNLYTGENDSKFRFFVAQEEIRDLEMNHMVDPNNVIFQTEMVMGGREKTMGIIIPMEKGMRFVITDNESGNSRVSLPGNLDTLAREYYTKSYQNKLSLRQFLLDAGCEFVEEDADIDLSVENLDKTTILDLFTNKKVLV